MIELFYESTPNTRKVAIFLEEAGLDYRLTSVSLERGEQHHEAFTALNPNGRIPVIIDHGPDTASPVTVFESGAILLYLAEKTGRFIPADMNGRFATIQWLFWQMAGLGPMAGQNGHFLLYAPEKLPYAIDRYGRETRRLYGVLETQLQRTAAFIAGEYSIADMATFPWIMTHKAQGLTLDDYPAVKRWFAEIRARPAVQRGLAAGGGMPRSSAPMTDARRASLFGAPQEPQ
ncbi:glutathione S-transferase N-terminal domain-containing protein [Sphingomonas sp. SRS2]|uniref:glutathione S-transferase N-terminal domain-containing protein n=1 Tax=Sphingomonas sp. SRS2 TaxID=133190 RepID=UPI0006184AA4|nr:glutathione S-transferase N-terminal domain-containing protein [Sphingomonas sp. SRS2]KKC24181.1 glutathione S-transferase [Sphingomonas sp. SRS2]